MRGIAIQLRERETMCDRYRDNMCERDNKCVRQRDNKYERAIRMLRKLHMKATCEIHRQELSLRESYA